MRLELCEPVTHVQERLLARQVKQQQKAHRITEKRCRQTAKPVKKKHFSTNFCNLYASLFKDADSKFFSLISFRPIRLEDLPQTTGPQNPCEAKDKGPESIR